MGDKTNINLLLIKNIFIGGANILKQDALSIGADVVLPRGAIVCKNKYVDIILIGSDKHFKILAKKELSQPFGLKVLGKDLINFIKPKQYKTKIMGVLNANEDSFFRDSRFNDKDAITKIEKMIEDGADIIDIGGVSSRPNSIKVSANEEFNRVKPIIDIIKNREFYKKVKFSIDSYEPIVVEYALKNHFSIVNDITGLDKDRIGELTAKYNASIVIMHKQGTPQTMQQNPTYKDIIIDIDNFFAKRIEKAEQFGIKDIILDVGIGFGKTLEHNLILLKNMEHFKHFGYELLIGASRKSMIDKIFKSKTEDRLSGTIAIHLNSLKKGVSIIRCHDVYEHSQAIKVWKAIEN